jgi:hypothetical protein
VPGCMPCAKNIGVPGAGDQRRADHAQEQRTTTVAQGARGAGARHASGWNLVGFGAGLQVKKDYPLRSGAEIFCQGGCAWLHALC